MTESRKRIGWFQVIMHSNYLDLHDKIEESVIKNTQTGIKADCPGRKNPNNRDDIRMISNP
jgi:hypothetical protein